MISPHTAGEAALCLDALVEHSRACELAVFELGASAPLTSVLADVLRTRAAVAGADPRRDALLPWAMEQTALDRAI